MDIQRAVTFVTEDEQWIKKLGIGLLMMFLFFLILPMFVVMGYGVQVARNVKDGMDVPLPEWDNLGGFFKDGLSIAVVGLVYSLPMIVLMIVGIVLVALGGATEMDAIMATGGVLLALLGCVVAIYSVALIAIGPAIYIQYLKHESIGACLRFSEVLNITRNNIGDILIAVLVMLGISFVTSIANVIPCLGALLSIAATPYILCVTAHLYGQIAAKELGKGSKFDDIILS